MPIWHFCILLKCQLYYDDIMMTIKKMRIDKGLTQEKCAQYLDIPLRTYKRYEANEKNINNIKLQYIINRLNEYGYIDEEHGLLTIDKIKEICEDVFKDYPVDYCYLFGSYAKGQENEKSDVDLLVKVPIDGLMYFELIEVLRERLKKKVDLLDVNQLKNNNDLLNEVLRDGIKIYKKLNY